MARSQVSSQSPPCTKLTNVLPQAPRDRDGPSRTSPRRLGKRGVPSSQSLVEANFEIVSTTQRLKRVVRPRAREGKTLNRVQARVQ